MLVLLTNDDGIDAPGLVALAGALHPDFEIAVVAPDRERSAVSHAVTFRRALHPLRIDRPFPAFAVNGTPADCVKLALHALLPERPGFVLSGINRGVNVGNDVLYSGTVAGALEAAHQGLRAAAVSVDFFMKPDFAPAARFARRLLENLKGVPFPKGVALNVNLPETGPYKGIAVTRQCGCLYRDRVRRKTGPDGREAFLLDGAMQAAETLEPGSDARAVKDGWVSVTPLSIELTWRDSLEGFRDALDRLGG